MAYVIISLGVCSIISQFVLLRELGVTFQGNELSLSIILFSWLIGSSLGGFLARYFIKGRNLKYFLIWLLFFNSVWFFAGIFLSRWLKIFFLIPAYQTLQPLEMLCISIISIIPLTLSFGTAFVLISSILNNPLKTYYLEALGAFIAGFLSLFLVKFFNSSQIMWIVSTLSLLAAASIKGKPPGLRLLISFAVIINILLPASGALAKFQNYTNQLRFIPQQLIASIDSIYANIAVTKSDSQYNLYENGRLSFSTENKEAIEEFTHMTLLSHPNPKKILLIGSGTSGIIAEILKHPGASVDYIEPDSELIKTTLKYIPQAEHYSLLDRRLKIYNQDGRFFVKSTKGKYDAVILNLGDPAALQLNRFYSVEFFHQIKRILNQGAKFCLAISSKEDILAAGMLKYNSCLYKSLASEFKNVDVIPGERILFISYDGPSLKLDSETLSEKFSQRKIQTQYFTPNHIKAKLYRQTYVSEKLAQELQNVQLNRDYFPHGFLYYLHLQGKQSSLGFSRISGFFSQRNLIYLAIAFFIFTFIHRKNIIKTAIVTTGFSGIALEIIISLIFQINFGFLYYRLGAIIAAFMLGLFLGSIFMSQVLKRTKTSGKRMLFYFELLIMLTSFLVCILLKQHQLLYLLFALLAGFLVGGEFGIFCGFYATSTVYSLDLAGACIGSLSAGLVLIPVLGIYKTCAAIGLVKLILLLFLRRQVR